MHWRVLEVIFEVLGASRGPLRASGSLLETSWGLSEASWAALGSWEAFGRILKTSGDFLGLSWRLMRRLKGAQERSQRDSGTLLAAC